MWSFELASTLFAIFIVSRVLKYQADKQKVLGIPGLRSIVSPAHPLGALIPTFSLNPGLSWIWYWRNQVYQRAGASTISVLAWLFGDPTIYTISMKVARQVVSMRGKFEKTAETTEIMTEFGHNIFAANGADWKTQRRIMAPAFSNDLHKLVWKETSALFEEMVETEQWQDKATVTLHSINELTTEFALNIISRCAFGNTMSWNWQKDEDGAMNFGRALVLTARSHIVRLVVPRWMYRLPIARLRELDAAHRTLKEHVATLFSSRRAEAAGYSADSPTIRHDLFSLMLGHSTNENGTVMSDDVLCGNIFLMLHAGHATTSRTLDAAIGFLAIYSDLQEEMYEEVKSAYLEDPAMSYDVYAKLPKTQACFLEASRLFPAVFLMFRRATEDVVIDTDDPQIYGGHLPLPKGTVVVVDMVGMHYNEEYFPDPEEFKPSRWYGARENDIGMFSFGGRACIGRRFSLVEGVGFLSRLLLKWRIEPVLKDDETPLQWRHRVLVPRTTMTLGVGDVPVRLVARN